MTEHLLDRVIADRNRTRHRKVSHGFAQQTDQPKKPGRPP